MARIATIPFIKGLKLGVIESGDYFCTSPFSFINSDVKISQMAEEDY